MAGGGGGGGGGPGVLIGIGLGESTLLFTDPKTSTIGVPLGLGGDCGNGSLAVGVRGEESRADAGDESASSTVGFGFVEAALGAAMDVASESVDCVISEWVRVSFLAALSRTVLGFDERVAAEAGDDLPAERSRRRLELDGEFLLFDGLDPASTLRRCSGVTTLTLFGVLIWFTLAGLRTSEAAVRGGLGGAAAVGVGRCAVGLLSPPLPRSVVFGVYSDNLGLTTSSLLPTASLLCAFEKVGYALGLALSGASTDARRCISGTTVPAILPLLDECETDLFVCSLRELSRSRSLVDEDEEVLLRVFEDRTLSLSSRSLSRSRSLDLGLLPVLRLREVL